MMSPLEHNFTISDPFRMTQGNNIYQPCPATHIKKNMPSSMLMDIKESNRVLGLNFDPDPLTIEELVDAERSAQDFECGRATDLPAEMSNEEVLAFFRSL